MMSAESVPVLSTTMMAANEADISQTFVAGPSGASQVPQNVFLQPSTGPGGETSIYHQQPSIMFPSVQQMPPQQDTHNLATNLSAILGLTQQEPHSGISMNSINTQTVTPEQSSSLSSPFKSVMKRENPNTVVSDTNHQQSQMITDDRHASSPASSVIEVPSSSDVSISAATCQPSGSLGSDVIASQAASINSVISPNAAALSSMLSQQGTALGTSVPQQGSSLGAAPVNLPEDGTLTSAIQRGIPVSILPGANPESIVLNQVFVPVYSNTDSGPVIELVPIKPPQQ